MLEFCGNTKFQHKPVCALRRGDYIATFCNTGLTVTAEQIAALYTSQIRQFRKNNVNSKFKWLRSTD